MASTLVFSPGESHGQRSLVGYSPWGHTESDTIDVTQHVCMHTYYIYKYIYMYIYIINRFIKHALYIYNIYVCVCVCICMHVFMYNMCVFKRKENRCGLTLN